MKKSFLQRRHEREPKYDIQVDITGVTMPDGMVHVHVVVDGEGDAGAAANILETAARVLRKGDDGTMGGKS